MLLQSSFIIEGSVEGANVPDEDPLQSELARARTMAAVLRKESCVLVCHPDIPVLGGQKGVWRGVWT